MLDLLDARPVPVSTAANHDAAYPRPERRDAPPTHWRWLALRLDEIDYGMQQLLDGGHVAHANPVAREELDRDPPLQLLGYELRARHTRDVAPLHDALADACGRGLRRLLSLGPTGHRISVAVVPLGRQGGDGRAATLLVFGKRNVCEDLSVQGFASSHSLTQAEACVLRALCKGVRPGDIAGQQGVAMSTIRTQISSIRAKTGADSIRALVQQVAVLPPLVSALRGGHLDVEPAQRPLPACA
jgi:DNA-binding CsgD family transcriptional regulator